MPNFSRFLILLALILLAATGARTASSSTGGYTVTVIAPQSYGTAVSRFGINNAGQVCGAAFLSGALRAFRWSPTVPNGTTGGLTNLGGYSGYNATAGFGMNELGDVVGRAGDYGASAGNKAPKTPQALLWPAGGTVQSLGGGGSVQEEAYAINSRREVALYHNTSQNSTDGVYVSKLVNGKRKSYFLGAGWPRDINEAGQVLSHGNTTNGNLLGAVLWTPTLSGTNWTRQQVLPDGGQGQDLNERGEVVGKLWMEDGYTLHPFIWLPTARYGLAPGLTDLWDQVLPALPPPSPGAEWMSAAAGGINDNGVVAGTAVSYTEVSAGNWVETDYAVWLWDEVNGARSVPVAGWNVWDLHGINNAGQIVARAWNGSSDGCLLLTPGP